MSPALNFTRMSKYSNIVIISLALFCCIACVGDEGSDVQDSVRRPQLTVEEASAFFRDHYSRDGTRAVSGPVLPFVFEAPVYDWDKAEASAVRRISSVDVPVSDVRCYRVLRENREGAYYEVGAYSKLVIVKSHAIDSLAAFIRVCIPDADYDGVYDGNICDLTLNCEDRYDYSGLEYYASCEGVPVAVVRYRDGKAVESVFLYDPTLSLEERRRLFASMMGNMWIVPCRTLTRNSNPEWDYGAPGTTFVDQTGAVYIYLDTDNDGKSDSISIYEWYRSSNGGSGGGSGSGGGFGSGDGTGSGGGFGSNPGNGTGSSSGGGFGTGTIGGGGAGGGTGGSGGRGTGTGKEGDGGIDGGGKGDGTLPRNPWQPVVINPILVDPIPWPVVPPPPDRPKFPEEERPCFDLESVRADPLMEMRILGTPVNGVKGGRYGKGRGPMHNGIDLAAPVGTPIYAMFDGTITKVVTKYSEDVLYKNYPTVYGGNENEYSAGNRIWIKSKTSKGILLIKYFHLQCISVEYGQEVKAGEIIGYTGMTGSASSKYSSGPHLHLEVYVNERRVDPEPFLYTQFDNEGKVTSPDCKK